MIDLENPITYIPEYFKVLTKPNSRGVSDLVPMVLWPSQQYYIENRTHRDIILKNRQTGMSTGIMAANAHLLFTVPYQRQTIVTHDQESSEFLFQTIQRFYHNLPDELRPERDWASGTRMRFPSETKDGGKGFDSYIYIDSAKSDSLGIARTLNNAHLSEIGKWPPRKEDQLFADVSQTVGAGGFITLESTPKGRGGLFYRLYDAGRRGDINYKTFFFPWWWDVTCIRDHKDILKYTNEEQQLISSFNLSPQQIAFRREKIAELNDLFYQEYPENDIDCWLSSEISVFDGVAIRRYLQQIQPGTNEGNITTWKGPIGGERYVIGVDCAGGLEKGDYTVATVLRVKTNEYVARLRGKIAPDMMGQELLRLGHRYNDALIAVEREGHGHTVLRILMENNYTNIYDHLEYDELSGAPVGQSGWKTNRKTKPMMVDSMQAALRAMDINIWSENFLMEASGYIVEGNIYKKAPGGYDDELDALMIALQVREQTPILEDKRYEVTSYAKL